MNIDNILTVERTFSKIIASSRKRALEEVSLLLAENIAHLNSDELFSSLIAREKIGSTAIGHGIAIPHCRMKNCPQIFGGLFSLEQAVDFESPDRSKTNLLFVLIVPEEETSEHLRVLAMLASRFDSKTYRQSLYDAESSEALYLAAIEPIALQIKQAQR